MAKQKVTEKDCGKGLLSRVWLASTTTKLLSCQSYDELPHIEARLIPVKYEVKLLPNRPGGYAVTEEKFRYEGPGADDFDLVCNSPPGFKYNVRLNIHYGDLATNKHFTLSSDAFDIYFCKEGSLLSRYIHKEHARSPGKYKDGSSRNYD